MTLPKDLSVDEAEQFRKSGVPTLEEVLEEAKLAVKEQQIKELTKKIEHQLQEKYSKSKGKDVVVVLTCTACTRDFPIKGKNNKGSNNPVQICPHIIFKSWEVKH